jgi:hypothetical protein
MKYRLCGLDLDNERKQFGFASTLKDARRMKKSMGKRGILLSIQNTQTSKLYE